MVHVIADDGCGDGTLQKRGHDRHSPRMRRWSQRTTFRRWTNTRYGLCCNEKNKYTKQQKYTKRKRRREKNKNNRNEWTSRHSLELMLCVGCVNLLRKYAIHTHKQTYMHRHSINIKHSRRVPQRKEEEEEGNIIPNAAHIVCAVLWMNRKSGRERENEKKLIYLKCLERKIDDDIRRRWRRRGRYNKHMVHKS